MLTEVSRKGEGRRRERGVEEKHSAVLVPAAAATVTDGLKKGNELNEEALKLQQRGQTG